MDPRLTRRAAICLAPQRPVTGTLALSRWSCFLAGGITGCPDWQADAIAALEDLPIRIYNPRRDDFDVTDEAATPVQVHWEHDMLRESDAILFWFPAESICPIALYELGAWSMTPVPLAVGCHPDYPRKRDVLLQTRLVRPELVVYEDLEHAVAQLRAYAAATNYTRTRVGSGG